MSKASNWFPHRSWYPTPEEKLAREVFSLRKALERAQKAPQHPSVATLRDKLNDPANHPVLTYAEAAEALHVKPKTIENYLCANKLDRANVEAHVTTQSVIHRLRTPKKKKE